MTDADITMILMLGVWFIFAVFVANYASKRGRSFSGWLVFGLLLSPLLAFILIAVLEPGTGGDGLYRICPFCAEKVKAAAKVCRYCQRDLPKYRTQPSAEVMERLRQKDLLPKGTVD